MSVYWEYFARPFCSLGDIEIDEKLPHTSSTAERCVKVVLVMAGVSSRLVFQISSC
jgi:hypothetical protein